MHHRRRLLATLACSCLLILLGCDGSQADGPPAPATDGFVRVKNGKVVGESGAPLWLRGVVFGSWFETSPEPPVEHHDVHDYERVSAMGMNTVRLFLDSQHFEGESPGTFKELGFGWLDQNVEWARAHHVYLIPALLQAPGGTGDCATDPFWETPEYQDRFVALWRAIAERYALEPVIAGYALLDNPWPTESLEQWQTLAERTTAAIREVDENHMLLVPRAHAIACTTDKPAAETFFTVADPNVLYEFDRQQPWDYVAQLLEGWGINEYGPYPNLATEWLHGSWDGRPGKGELRLKPDETDWTKKEFYYTITDEKFQFAVPALQADLNPTGTAYFDDIVIEEFDENASSLGIVMELDLEEDALDWFLWEGDADGNTIEGPGVVGLSDDHHLGKKSVTITGTSTHANLNESNKNRFPVTLGHTYKVTSWIKGENTSPDSAVMTRLDFWGHKNSTGGFDRAALALLFDDFVGWGHAQGVPMNVFSVSAGRPCFENRGGIAYMGDMLDIMIEKDLHFTYFAYHEPDWGIYSNATGLPDPATVNQPLVDLFIEKLR